MKLKLFFFVLLPSFVFDPVIDTNEVANETFVPLKTITVTSKIDQSALDLKNVVLAYTNENYVPPSSLPKLPPLVFHTFKRPVPLKAKPKKVQTTTLDLDSIELASEQIEM